MNFQIFQSFNVNLILLKSLNEFLIFLAKSINIVYEVIFIEIYSPHFALAHLSKPVVDSWKMLGKMLSKGNI